MQTVWRKVTSNTSTNNNKIQKYSRKNKQNHQNSNNNATRTSWSADMISSHLPIYPINSENDEWSIPKILFDTISPSIDCVLLGECTHGTHEFYKLRSLITKYLILTKGFTSVFIEMDWPNVYRLNQYVLGRLDNSNITIDEIFDDLKEYPLWMYRNNIIKELIIWLKAFNMKLKENNKTSEMVTFYGIDMQTYKSLNVLKTLYNKNKKLLPHSLQIISYLDAIDLNFYHSTERQYAHNQMNKIYQLFLSSKHKILQKQHSQKQYDLVYNIDQNFMTLLSAIHYFNNDCLWDIRDNHWFNTIEKYFYYKSDGKYLGIDYEENNDDDMITNKGRIILWAHNSHLCHSDYTNYTHSNIGSILKNKYGQQSVYTICFDSFKGSVTATNHRNEYPQFFNLDENVDESFGNLWHKISNQWNENNLMIFLKNGIDKINEMEIDIEPKYFINIKKVKKKRKIRDIGVCYMYSNPYNHCSNGNILEIADAMIFVDKSNALEPFQCDKHKNWDKNRKVWIEENNQRNNSNNNNDNNNDPNE